MLGENVLVWKNKQIGYNVLTVNDLTHIWYLEIPKYEYGNIQSYIFSLTHSVIKWQCA